jgi:hypothetical protein
MGGMCNRDWRQIPMPCRFGILRFNRYSHENIESQHRICCGRKMATQLNHNELDLQEQIVRIRKAIVEIDKTMDDSAKARAEHAKILRETEFMPRAMIFQAMIATAGLLGTGAALARLFYSG